MKKILSAILLLLVIQLVLSSCSQRITPERAAQGKIRRGAHL
jgi:hypothetical protein